MRLMEIKWRNITYQVPEKKMFLVTDILPKKGEASVKRLVKIPGNYNQSVPEIPRNPLYAPGGVPSRDMPMLKMQLPPAKECKLPEFKLPEIWRKKKCEP